MINSMTGFGRGEAADEYYQVTVEMKSVNHRFLELAVRLPRSLSAAEDGLKKQIQAALNRGKVDVFVTVTRVAAKKSALTVDKDRANAYYTILVGLAKELALPATVNVLDIAAYPGVIEEAEEEDHSAELSSLLERAAADAIAALCRMRAAEGAALTEDLQRHIATVQTAVTTIAEQAPRVVIEQRDKLRQRIADLLADAAVNEDRLANEIAFYADRVDISEELARLSSHIAQFTASCSVSEPIGRKLEFILQEMLRETNTIGSKANALLINRQVIEIKGELEKLREQIQNVE